MKKNETIYFQTYKISKKTFSVSKNYASIIYNLHFQHYGWTSNVGKLDSLSLAINFRRLLVLSRTLTIRYGSLRYFFLL